MIRNSDMILNYPDEYIKKEEYKNIIEHLFCVGNLEYTRILSSHMRPLRILEKFRKQLNISDHCNEIELREKLLYLKVGIIRRKVINGIKQDNDYHIDCGIIMDIENVNCYFYSNLLIKTKEGIERIRTSRVYYLIN